MTGFRVFCDYCFQNLTCKIRMTNEFSKDDLQVISELSCFVEHLFYSIAQNIYMLETDKTWTDRSLLNHTVKKTSTLHKAGTTEDEVVETRFILHSIWFTVAGSFKNKTIFTLHIVCCARTDSTKNNVCSTLHKEN